MPWYDKSNKPTLDYSKPIIAIDKQTKHVELLLPTTEKGTYIIQGYNWFDLALGRWNSCATFPTPQEAVKARSFQEVKNTEIKTS